MSSPTGRNPTEPELQNIPSPLDYHGQTVSNPAFQAFMNSLYDTSWQEWDFKDKRAAAKRWNFTKLYSAMSPISLDQFLKSDRGK